jgi:hypothetical protein
MKQWIERDTMRAGVHVYMSIGMVLCSLFPDSTSPDPGEGNHVPGPILDRHEARNFGCHTDRVCISLPHSFITTGKQDGHPGGALDHLLVPAWAREEAPEKKIIIFGITEGICHIMHRPNLTYQSVRSTNEGDTIKTEREVHDDPGPLICHRTVGCRDRHGEDFSFLF